jgi:hypothetical protein
MKTAGIGGRNMSADAAESPASASKTCAESTFERDTALAQSETTSAPSTSVAELSSVLEIVLIGLTTILVLGAAFLEYAVRH